LSAEEPEPGDMTGYRRARGLIRAAQCFLSSRIALSLEIAHAMGQMWNRLSPRVATVDNEDYLPSLSTFAAGIRYRGAMLAHPWTIRLDGFNLADPRGIHLSSLGSMKVPQHSGHDRYCAAYLFAFIRLLFLRHLNGIGQVR